MAFTATTTNSAAAWRPDLFTFEPQDALPDAAILSHATLGGRIEGDQPAVRVAYVLDDTADFVAEGAEIDESAPELSEALVYTRKFAQLVRISREQYRQNGTADELARSVERAMTTKADSAFLAQTAPVGPDVAPVAGLANWAGVLTETVDGDLDALVDLEAAVRANGANPTVWLLAPDTWAALRKMRTASGSNQNLLGAGTDDAAPRLLSIPVAVNARVPSMTGLLVDKRAVISAVSQLEIATSFDQYFTSDSVAVRATMRTGHVVPRPDRLGRLYIGGVTLSSTLDLGGATDGTFTLTFRGRTTAAIAHNANAGAVKTALVALDDGLLADAWTVTAAEGKFTIGHPAGVLTGSGELLVGGTGLVIS